MKRSVFVIITLLMAITMQAQELKMIKLNAPNKTKGEAVMKVLNDRQSIREYAAKELAAQDLSDLLWAANGINRPDGKRTAPSAMNRQEVDVYVVMKTGAYLYDAKEHALKPVTAGDYRAAVAGPQDFAKEAPVSLVLVADLARLGDPASDRTKLMASVDVGIVCQNINLACTGLGLATVPRATMDQDVLRKALKLNDNQLLLMNNPVGYPQ
ncbi:SagB/ThcOx family dehydrogenase [Parabacteroides sp. PF5-6]|uniref:SagB/ThcOx family dehydrogenase n=1 Tax=Parabacteroides sp. PF5-6 TaxID=1742403 RepID=UPI0024074AAC|nr:SagB/ThcOx family dehydrogenase [Parabacteroides sp. PF5-6]MDF9830555.1 SagB-type dehydrogenase family enzyme [Parabacteroides sp. PF5-6]